MTTFDFSLANPQPGSPHLVRPELAMLGPQLRRIGRMMQASVETRFGAADINFTQGCALQCLQEADATATKALAAKLNVAAGSTCRILDGLETRGLIRRGHNATGCRVASITPAGTALLRDVAPILNQRLSLALADLTDSEIDTLVQLLGKLAESVDRHAAGPAHPTMEA